MSYRFGPGPPSAIRKSRLEGKPSLLPVMRRPGSTDRISTEAQRSSNIIRSSSADPPARTTFGGGRLSREVSARKTSTNRRSRSQTSDSKYGLNFVTPLRSGQRLLSTTPRFTRTPEDRSTHRWEMCLERALAYVTVKDQRPITSIEWQRAEYARVSAALGGAQSQGGALVRPLTIARFINIVLDVITPLLYDVKLTTDNYITKLPHVAKRLLYPAAVSKSWLRAVNTLHAFPQALALIGYLLDLDTDCQMPDSDESLYVRNDELALMQRDHLKDCWLRFNDTDTKFDDLIKKYAANLKNLFSDDEEKLQELYQNIKKYESQLDDEEVVAGRLEEVRRAERRDALAAGVRALRAERRAADAEREGLRARRADRLQALRADDCELERASLEAEQLRAELQQQSMSAEERARLRDELDYCNRVCETKRALDKQLATALEGKEAELGSWQGRSLAAAARYNHGLAQLAAPALAGLAVDEKDLMSPECALHIARAVETLKEEGGRLATRKAELLRTRSELQMKRAQLLEENRSKIAELKPNIQRERDGLDEETFKETSAAAVWGKEQREIRERVQQLQAYQQQHDKLLAELDMWEKRESKWRHKLEEMHKYIEAQKVYAQQKLIFARERRLKLVGDTLALWNSKLDAKQSDPARRTINM